MGCREHLGSGAGVATAGSLDSATLKQRARNPHPVLAFLPRVFDAQAAQAASLVHCLAKAGYAEGYREYDRNGHEPEECFSGHAGSPTG